MTNIKELKKPQILYLITTMLLSFGAQQATASDLTNEAIYYRCYAQLTQERPSLNDTLTQQVINGQVNPVTACMQIFDKALLTANGNTRISSTSDSVGKSVLRQMHRLHYSWFQVKDIPTLQNNNKNAITKDFYDISSPALYYTRALFDPSSDFSTAITSSDNLEALRTTQNPTNGAASNRPKSDTIFNASTVFAPIGDLLGVKATGNRSLPYSYGTNTGNYNVTAHVGGGLMGTQAYRLLNVNEPNGFKSNGALKMPRKWARAIFQDLMCRELPVVRFSDVGGFVSTNTNSAPFRQEQACVRCHASMDRMASTLRNFKYNSFGTTNPPELGVDFADSYSVTQSAGAAWSDAPDNNFHVRPPSGVLYYRNYQGNLININVTSVADLGTKIANQDDFYICAASRYYEYFTGIHVDIGDLDGKTISTDEQTKRNHIIQLGQKLKTTQDARQLINDILNSPEYGKSDFRLRSATNGN